MRETRPLGTEAGRAASEQPALRHGHLVHARYDEVVEKPDVDLLEDRLEPGRQLDIARARFANARRVIVEKDYRRGVATQAGLQDLAGIHCGSVDGPVEKILHGKQAIACGQEYDAEDLALVAGEMQRQEAAHGLAAAEDRGRLDLLEGGAAQKFPRGDERGRLGGPDAIGARERVSILAEEPMTPPWRSRSA